MTEASFWWVNPVVVRTYVGVKNGVRQYADADTVDCWVEEGTVLVRNAAGDEVTSSTAVHGPLDQAAKFVPGSIVTTPGSSESVVITRDRLDSGSLDLELDHFVAHLE